MSRLDGLFNNSRIWWSATGIYFCYVALGGVSPRLHRHIYTGDREETIFERLKKGKPVAFARAVYNEFFLAFRIYFRTYRLHVLCSAIWLVTGVLNLRNQPEFERIENGRKIFSRGRLHFVSGYFYLLSGFVKGLTASMMSWFSHSLGFARIPMILFGVWDMLSLAFAVSFILKGDVAAHRRWMVRNFSAGGGSIWTRVFGAVWALFDPNLTFMSDSELYRQMNNIVLVTGFTFGPLFGEFWLARKTNSSKRDLALVGMFGCCAATAACGRQIYSQRRRDMDRNEKILRKLHSS